MKTLMILLTSLICFAPIYGQSKNRENKEEARYIMLDSVQINDYMVLDELQQTIIPYMIKHKLTPEKSNIYVGFDYLPQRGHYILHIGIDGYYNDTTEDYITENYIGYCIIKDYLIFFIGNESYEHIKKVSNRQRAFKRYPPTPDYISIIDDSGTDWFYLIRGNLIELVSHTDWYRNKD